MFLKRLFTLQSKTVTSAAIIIGAASLLSRALGVLRDRVLAGELGASRSLDMYYAAFRLPDLVFNLVVIGAISAGFIPLFVAYKDKNVAGWRFANTVINWLLLFMALVTVLLLVMAPTIIPLLTPGFSSAEIAVTTTLSTIMFLSPLLLALSGIFGGILQSHQQFFVYALSPIFYNIGIIIGALFFVPFFGIYGLAWGVVLGALLHLIIQVPNVFALGYRYQFVLEFTDEIRTLIRTSIPRLLSILVNQGMLFVITAFGSMMVVGSIAVYNLANNLQSFPLGVFGISFAVAAFPALSALQNDSKRFINQLASTVRQVLFFVIPASALLIILRAQIVRVILGTGNFDWQDTVLTLNTVSILALSLCAQALILLYMRAFFAVHDSKTPLLSSIVCALATCTMAWYFGRWYGVIGLALAYSLGQWLQCFVLWLSLRYRFGRLNDMATAISIAKMLCAVVAGGAATQGLKILVETYSGTSTFIGIFTQSFIASLGGIFVYALICKALRLEELDEFIVAFRQRMRRDKNVSVATEAIESE
jgi:putative peptidoglycan lipid II flippase